MANFRFSQGTKERELFEAYWRLCQTFWKVEDTDTYWNDLHDQCLEFSNNYGSFATKLGTALTNELKEKYKKQVQSNSSSET